ncbi:putative glyoxalase superfamily protein PhnB [Kibdelosporangium banguiense]|uniref:Glyoxalase superfamily protein PhnB n=2 Tax=Kibdelosporangium banguiense TaxID=1365924 RepID=A0ABS4TUG2_9PSEU|nr:putative glyoxalase superfamily protein PhnB [Kibdelosporangium banguiense]
MTNQISVHPYFGYRDALAAMEWLAKSFGFETTMSFPDEQGGIAHAEMRLGDAVIIIFSDVDGYERAPRKGDTTGLGMYLTLPGKAEVDTLHEQAVGNGATSVYVPEETPWGNYRGRVIDLEGYEWSFGVHRPGEPQTQWD